MAIALHIIFSVYGEKFLVLVRAKNAATREENE